MTTDLPAPPKDPDISPVTIEEEMRRSYLDYAMSVIVSRALPDVRDGLKPVHRRILYAMKEAGYDYNRPYRKSATSVGEVMGKYHPHGDSPIYDAMVRMAQDFSMRLELIDGQGNFGSMDGDPPAAMRYTESRLSKAAHTLLEDIDRETVDFQPNYDESTTEPKVLPARFPNLLVNGAGGIAVGMATNIPTHNLGEVIDACCAYLDEPTISIDGLMQYVPGPDFPTGAIIQGKSGIRAAYHLGRGSIVMRGRTHFEDMPNNRTAIIVTEVPFQVNKARMVERIAEVVNAKHIEGIADLRDESDRHGVRVVVELKRDAEQDVVLAQLYRFTPLQSTFGVNMLALNEGRPELLDLKRVIASFIAFREQVITRRTIYNLGKARDRAHVLVGLGVAVANLDEVIRLIRAAPDPASARERLVAKRWPAEDVAPLIKLIDEPGRLVDEDGTYQLSEAQARAILELRLHRLTGLERDKIGDDLRGIVKEIEGYLEILANPERLRVVLREELLAVRQEFADERRTTIQEGEFEQDIEDLIQREDMVVTVTHGGYVKRVPLSTYRAQRRGGRGRAGMQTRDEDFVSQIFVLNTHTPVLFFSSRGMVYKLKVYKLPLGTPQARGKALVNLLPLEQGETITTLMPLPEDEETWGDLWVMFATEKGNVRRNRLSDFVNVWANGKIAMKLDDDDRLIGVQTCDQDDDVLLAAGGGRCIRFPTTDVRLFSGRTSSGVRGIKLGRGDKLISMSILRHAAFDTDERDAYLRRRRIERAENGAGDENGHAPAISDERYDEMKGLEQFILTVSSDGYGKRSSAHEYRVAGRGGQGIANIDLNRGASVVGSFPVRTAEQIVLVTNGGQIIRTRVDEIRIAGRATRGVTLFRVGQGERVVSVTTIGDEAENGDVEDGDAGNGGDA